MKISLMILFIGFCFVPCHAQKVQWSTTKNWKIYKGEGKQIFSYTIDTLKSLKSKILDKDSIQFFLQKSLPIPPEKTPVWMGSYLASYELPDGKTCKVEVSTYGGFFYDQSSGKYYSVPREWSPTWLNYITGNIPD
jgi:hypothetical protein